MRVAFVTPYDARDVGNWSGIPWFIGRGLERHDLTVDYVGPVASLPTWADRARASILWRTRRQSYWPQVRPAAVRRMASLAADRISAHPPDVVLGLSPEGLAGLPGDVPAVLWTDCPWAGLIDWYDYAMNPSAGTRRGIRDAEQAALDRCAAVVYASDWAATLARRTYRLSADKVHVIPFGGNLTDPPSADTVAGRAVDGPWRLLFLGVDWARKGGEIALAAARSLAARGRLVRLSVVGCDVPTAVRDDPLIDAIGFVSKRTDAGRARLAELLSTSHLLLLPTRAEAYGCAFAEASAYGLPSVTTDVGGVGGVVTDDVNGVRLPLAADGVAYADWIADLMADPDRYRRLCLSARAAFDDRLNWDAATGKLVELFRRVAGPSAA